jgi:hypothetical protein
MTEYRSVNVEQNNPEKSNSSFTFCSLSLSGVLSAQKLHTADTRMTGAKSQEEGQEKGVNDRLSIPVLLSTCGNFQLDVD